MVGVTDMCLFDSSLCFSKEQKHPRQAGRFTPILRGVSSWLRLAMLLLCGVSIDRIEVLNLGLRSFSWYTRSFLTPLSTNWPWFSLSHHKS